MEGLPSPLTHWHLAELSISFDSNFTSPGLDRKQISMNKSIILSASLSVHASLPTLRYLFLLFSRLYFLQSEMSSVQKYKGVHFGNMTGRRDAEMVDVGPGPGYYYPEMWVMHITGISIVYSTGIRKLQNRDVDINPSYLSCLLCFSLCYLFCSAVRFPFPSSMEPFCSMSCFSSILLLLDMAW